MSSYFYSRITFPNPHILLKGKTLCVSLKFVLLGFSVLLVPYMITFHPYQSQKNMQSLISWNF